MERWENERELDVYADRLKHISKDKLLLEGSMFIEPLVDILEVEGNGVLPIIKQDSKVSIDGSRVTIVESKGSRGEYELVYPSKALTINIDSSVYKGTYESTIYYDIVVGP